MWVLPGVCNWLRHERWARAYRRAPVASLDLLKARDKAALFSEPGVLIVRPDGTLYCGSTQTMPFARPSFQDLLGAIDFAVAKDYPARGEYTGSL